MPTLIFLIQITSDSVDFECQRIYICTNSGIQLMIWKCESQVFESVLPHRHKLNFWQNGLCLTLGVLHVLARIDRLRLRMKVVVSDFWATCREPVFSNRAIERETTNGRESRRERCDGRVNASVGEGVVVWGDYSESRGTRTKIESPLMGVCESVFWSTKWERGGETTDGEEKHCKRGDGMGKMWIDGCVVVSQGGYTRGKGKCTKVGKNV